jgi:hypothetical protein
MKKKLLVLLFCAAVSGAYAQNIRFGGKFMYSSTWLFNNNISDKGEEINYASAFGTSFGLTGLMYFNEKMGVSADILMTTHNGKYTLNSGAEKATDKLSYVDIPILFHIGNSEQPGGYVEIGPQFSFLTGAKETIDNYHTDFDIKNNLNSFNLAGVLGFGYTIGLSDNWFCDLGIRLAYGFSDVTKEYTLDEAQALVEPSGLTAEAHTAADGSFSYQKTTRAYGGINIGIVYKP